MNEADESSYYEIALTNRQVLVAFIILLVCMLASFFAGLWAGRGGSLSAPGDPVTALAEEAGLEDQGLEEFTFFSEAEDQESPDLKELVDDPNPNTTLVEDVGGKLPAAETEKKAGRSRSRKVPEAPPEAQNPAIPRATARKAPPPDSSALHIQVFSSREVRQARKVLRQLLDAGYGAFMSPVEVDGETMYRVRIGPFADRAAAEKAAAQVRGRFRLDTWITSG